MRLPKVETSLSIQNRKWGKNQKQKAHQAKRLKVFETALRKYDGKTGRKGAPLWDEPAKTTQCTRKVMQQGTGKNDEGGAEDSLPENGCSLGKEEG